MKAFLFSFAFLIPLAVVASTDFSYTSPLDSASVTITPNQSLPVLANIRNTTSGLGAGFPAYFSTRVTVALACPPAANPCANYLTPTPALAPFVLYGGQAFVGAVTTINFQAAPPGYYSIKVSLTGQDCFNTLSCQVPDTFGGSIQFTIQVLSAAPSPANVLSHFAVGGSFATDLLVMNASPKPGQFSIHFYTDAGLPAPLPVTGLGTISTLTDTVPGFGSGFYEVGDPNVPTQGGWAFINADPGITVQGLFRNRSANGTYFEAAVPTYSGTNEFRMTFDATTFAPTGDPLYTGFAIVNLDAKNPATITCTARDFRGNVIPNAVVVPALNPLGHWANYLFPMLTGARGTIDCTSNNMIAGVGLRFIGTNAFSSLPILTE